MTETKSGPVFQTRCHFRGDSDKWTEAMCRLDAKNRLLELYPRQSDQIQQLNLEICGSATLRGSVSAETAFPRASWRVGFCQWGVG